MLIWWRRDEFETGGRYRSGTKVGGTDEKFFWSCPSTFLAFKVQLVVLLSAFVMVSTVWSVSCLMFFYSRCPRAQPFVKVGARAPVPHGVDATVLIIIIFHTLGINVPKGGLKKIVKMKRLGMSKIPRGHKRAYCHVQEQR